MSRLGSPSATSASTSCSRAVSDSISGSRPRFGAAGWRKRDHSFRQLGAIDQFEIRIGREPSSQRVELVGRAAAEEHSERHYPRSLGRSLTVTVTSTALRAANHRDRHRRADRVAAQTRHERLGILNRLAAEADDHVADQQAAAFGRTVRRHLADQQAGRLRSSRALPLGKRHRHRADAEKALLRAAFGRDLRRGRPRERCGNDHGRAANRERRDDAERAARRRRSARRRSTRRAATAECESRDRSSSARPVRSGPPTTAIGASVAMTPPLQVRPTATPRWPGFGSCAGASAGRLSPSTRTTVSPMLPMRPSTTPSAV